MLKKSVALSGFDYVEYNKIYHEEVDSVKYEEVYADISFIKSERDIISKEGTRYVEWAPDFSKKEPLLHCACGYEGVADVVHHQHRIGHYPVKFHPENAAEEMYSRYCREEKKMIFYSINEKWLSVVPTFACPTCERKADVVLNRLKRSFENVDWFDVKETKNSSGDVCSLSFQWEVTRYKDSARGISSDSTSFMKKETWQTEFSVDLVSGKTHLCGGEEEKLILDVTFGGMRLWTKFEITRLATSPKASDAFYEFLELCLKKRGVQYLTLGQITEKEEESASDLLEGGEIFRALVFLYCPSLQHTPWMDWRMPPESVKRLMKSWGDSQKEILRSLTGHSSTSICRAMSKHTNFTIVYLLGCIIKDPNHLLKLLDVSDLKGGKGQFRLRRASDMSVIEDSVNIHGESKEKKMSIFSLQNVFDFEKAEKGFRFIRGLHTSEKSFVQALLRLSKKSDVPTERFDFLYVLGTVIDLSEHYLLIKQAIPAYEFVYRKDIKALHDQFSREYNRIQHENICIPYTKQERERYECKMNGYQFTLAEDTHQLIDVGGEMDICVGGYGERAAKKETLIVLMRNRKGEVMICLEVSPERRKLVQAKTHKNQCPNEEEARVILEWAIACQVDASETHDLKSNSLKESV